MISIKIHNLTTLDGSRFREIRLRSLQDAPDAFGSTYDATAARPLEVWPEQLANMPTFVATLDGVDVGVVRGARDEERADTAWLLSMWVAPLVRGKGIADALVEAVVNWARDCGFSRLVLDVADNNQAAIGLYQRQGFLPNGETGTLPPPRQHVGEHRRVRVLR